MFATPFAALTTDRPGQCWRSGRGPPGRRGSRLSRPRPCPKRPSQALRSTEAPPDPLVGSHGWTGAPGRGGRRENPRPPPRRPHASPSPSPQTMSKVTGTAHLKGLPDETAVPTSCHFSPGNVSPRSSCQEFLNVDCFKCPIMSTSTQGSPLPPSSGTRMPSPSTSSGTPATKRSRREACASRSCVRRTPESSSALPVTKAGRPRPPPTWTSPVSTARPRGRALWAGFPTFAPEMHQKTPVSIPPLRCTDGTVARGGRGESHPSDPTVPPCPGPLGKPCRTPGAGSTPSRPHPGPLVPRALVLPPLETLFH